MTLRREGRPTKLAERIAEIARAVGLPVGEGPFVLHRTRAGHWQRSSGAWLWWLADGKGVEVAGSCDTAREIVKAAREGRVVALESCPRELMIEPPAAKVAGPCKTC